MQPATDTLEKNTTSPGYPYWRAPSPRNELGKQEAVSAGYLPPPLKYYQVEPAPASTSPGFCIQQAQGGLLQEAQQRFLMLPLGLRRAALEQRGTIAPAGTTGRTLHLVVSPGCLGKAPGWSADEPGDQGRPEGGSSTQPEALALPDRGPIAAVR